MCYLYLNNTGEGNKQTNTPTQTVYEAYVKKVYMFFR